MVVNNPGQGWGQYYSGGQIQWDKIIITGHSQGGALAAIMGKRISCKASGDVSMMDFLDSDATSELGR